MMDTLYEEWIYQWVDVEKIEKAKADLQRIQSRIKEESLELENETDEEYNYPLL